MEEISLGHGLARSPSILRFVYWPGGDTGVFHSSRLVVDPKPLPG